jgi:hypothetical protein
MVGRDLAFRIQTASRALKISRLTVAGQQRRAVLRIRSSAAAAFRGDANGPPGATSPSRTVH